MMIRDAIKEQVKAAVEKLTDALRAVRDAVGHAVRAVSEAVAHGPREKPDNTPEAVKAARMAVNEFKSMKVKPDIEYENRRLAYMMKIAQQHMEQFMRSGRSHHEFAAGKSRGAPIPQRSPAPSAPSAPPTGPQPAQNLDRVYADAVATQGGYPTPTETREAAEGAHPQIDRAAERAREDENAGWKPRPEHEHEHEPPEIGHGR